MKIILKCLFLIFMLILCPYVSKAGGPAGYLKTADPDIKSQLVESLKSIEYHIGKTDDEIEGTIARYLYKHSELLRSQVHKIQKDEAVDTAICLMMYKGHWKFEVPKHFNYYQCNKYIKIP